MLCNAATRRVHLQTSPWILVPALFAGRELSILLCLTCAASVAHWGWYRLGSAQHWLDCVLASSTVCYLLVVGEAPVRALTGCAVFFFLYGRNAAKEQAVKLGSHTLFRFLAFWACCAQTGNTHLVSPVVAGLVSGLFWLHVFCVARSSQQQHE